MKTVSPFFHCVRSHLVFGGDISFEKKQFERSAKYVDQSSVRRVNYILFVNKIPIVCSNFTFD